MQPPCHESKGADPGGVNPDPTKTGQKPTCEIKPDPDPSSMKKQDLDSDPTVKKKRIMIWSITRPSRKPVQDPDSDPIGKKTGPGFGFDPRMNNSGPNYLN